MDQEFAAELGGRLTKALEASRFDGCSDAARCIGMSSQQLCAYRSGARVPNAMQVKRLCRCFGISADWLLGLEQPASTEADEASRLVAQMSDEGARIALEVCKALAEAKPRK